MQKIRTHYDNLQIAEHASDEVIRGAYRYLCQKWHPDKHPEDTERAARIMRLINQAYEVLSDPELRKAHDAWIKQRRADFQEAQEHAKARAAEANARSDSEGGMQRETAQSSAHGEATAKDTSAAVPQSEYDFFVYPDESRMASGLIASILFVAIGIGLFVNGGSDDSFWGGAMKSLAIYIGVPFFACTGMLCFSRLIYRSPSIIINEYGVEVIALAGGTLRWSEISDVRIEKYNNVKLIAIYPQTPEILAKRQSLWGRVSTHLDALFIGRPQAIFIGEALIEIPLEQLLREIASRKPTALSSRDFTSSANSDRGTDKDDDRKPEWADRKSAVRRKTYKFGWAVGAAAWLITAITILIMGGSGVGMFGVAVISSTIVAIAIGLIAWSLAAVFMRIATTVSRMRR